MNPLKSGGELRCSGRVSNSCSVLSSFMTYHWLWYKSNTTGATRGTGTAYPFGTPEYIPVSVGFVLVFLVIIKT
jgi:hypothetical protein